MKNNKPVMAIDPGNEYSAWCVYFPDTHSIGSFGKAKNNVVREVLKNSTQWEHDYAIEIPRLIGQQVWQQCIDTAVEAGRFRQIIQAYDCATVYRHDVKMHLLGRSNGNDSQIRQAIMSLFPATGGGKNPVVGIKSNPGPLFGVSKDVWAALGVALAHHHNRQAQND